MVLALRSRQSAGLLPLLILLTAIAATTTPMAFAQTWSKTYWHNDGPGNGYPIPWQIAEASDGSLLVASHLYNCGAVHKLDPYGNFLWSRRFQCAAGGGVYGVAGTQDGGIVGAGAFSVPVTANHDFTAFKLDPAGVLQWYRDYGADGWVEQVRAMAQGSDGSLLIAGDSSLGGTAAGKELWLVKTDPDGNVVWQKRYGGNASDFMLVGHMVEFLPDGGIAVVGVTKSWGTQDQDDTWLLFLEADGTITFQTTITEESANPWPSALKATSNASVFVATNSNSRFAFDPPGIWLLKFDPSGALSWQKRYAETTWPTNISMGQGQIQELANGDLVVLGTYTSLSGGANKTVPFLMRISTESGAVVWAKTYEFIDTTPSLHGISLAVTDSGHMLIGSQYSLAGTNGAWLIKTDGDGEIDPSNPSCTQVGSLTITVDDTAGEVATTDAVPVDSHQPTTDVSPNITDELIASHDECVPDAPRIETVPWMLDFGAIDQGTTAFRNLEIRNTGTLDLWVSDMLADPPYSVPMTCAGATIPPGETCNAEVEFGPILPGIFQSELAVESDDPGRPSLPVSLYGIGLATNEIFADGFESGDLAGWSAVVP